LAESLLAAAQATPQGRARIALGAALGDIPGWFDPASPEPAANDFATQEANQFLWLQRVDFPFAFALRAELEFRAAGNPSWNTGVDYFEQFEHSVNKAEVKALYKAAGLNLHDDLETLNHAARISANKASVEYLEQNIIFNGEIDFPVLTMHTTGDGLVANQNETAYRNAVHEAGEERRLRQIFVHRAGHCTFTPAETVTALANLIHRLDTGRWPDLDAAVLNAEASALGPLNIAPAAFIPFDSAPFLRPFDTFIDARCERRGGNEQTCKAHSEGEE
jgi:hypothetical protein